MVHPKYTPEEALAKIKLHMKYDASKTLNENKVVVSEKKNEDDSLIKEQTDTKSKK